MTDLIPVPEFMREAAAVLLSDFNAFIGDCFEYVIDDAKVGKVDGKWVTNEEWELCAAIHWALDGEATHTDCECVLDRCAAYMESRSDVSDGDYGIPEANRPMSILEGLSAARWSLARIKPGPRLCPEAKDTVCSQSCGEVCAREERA